MLLVVERHRTIAILVHFLKPKVTFDVRNTIASETTQTEQYEQALLIHSHVPPLSRERSTKHNSLVIHALKMRNPVPINHRG
jgi:hypothetical protein